MKETPVVSLRGVRKSYGSFELGPVDLEIEPGYVVAVVGPNGSGKSTLIRMLMNLVQPSSGEVSLFGSSYPGDEVAIKQRIGYVPERSVGHAHMSADSLGEFVSHWYPGWDQRGYEEHVKRLDVEPGRKFCKLSRGVQRRLVFALALATGAELLLLDEPTEGVDPFARLEMLEEISSFTEGGAGKTVVFATHLVEEVRSVADYVALLVDGKLLGLYEKDDLRQRWKSFWLDSEPEGEVPGVVEVVEGGTPTRIVTNSPRETGQALSAQNIRIVRSRGVDLGDILFHMLRRSREDLRA